MASFGTVCEPRVAFFSCCVGFVVVWDSLIVDPRLAENSGNIYFLTFCRRLPGICVSLWTSCISVNNTLIPCLYCWSQNQELKTWPKTSTGRPVQSRLVSPSLACFLGFCFPGTGIFFLKVSMGRKQRNGGLSFFFFHAVWSVCSFSYHREIINLGSILHYQWARWRRDAPGCFHNAHLTFDANAWWLQRDPASSRGQACTVLVRRAAVYQRRWPAPSSADPHWIQPSWVEAAALMDGGIY